MTDHVPTPGGVLRIFEFSENTLEKDARFIDPQSFQGNTPTEYLLGIAIHASIDCVLDDELNDYSYTIIERQHRQQEFDVLHTYVVEFLAPKQRRDWDPE